MNQPVYRTVRAAAHRPALRVPMTLLAAALLACLAVLLYALLSFSHAARQEAGGSARLGAILAAAYIYLRWIYVRHTWLRIDAEGIWLHQPLGHWHEAWNDVVSVSETGFLTPTHRGGVGAGLTLQLRSGRRRQIPDVFALPRSALATLIEKTRREYRP